MCVSSKAIVLTAVVMKSRKVSGILQAGVDQHSQQDADIICFLKIPTILLLLHYA